MKLSTPLRLAFAITTVAMFAAPVLGKGDEDKGSPLKNFQVECAVTSTATTCQGEHIGTATFTDTGFFVGATLGVDGRPGDVCFLDAEDFVLTTDDGSTITFETSGTQCNGSADYRRQHSYLITGGTGRFAGVTGAGNYVVSGLLPGAPATIHLEGNIQFPS